MDKKKIVIAGGTGFLGGLLTKHFVAKGYLVVILTRKHKEDTDMVRYVKWDGHSLGNWRHTLERADALINLNGKSVDCRYTEKNKQAIYDTRIDATNTLGKAIDGCVNPPKVWINASSATIYRHAEDQVMDEYRGEMGNGFSVDVCKKWEDAFWRTNCSETRRLALRIAIVLSQKDGALKPLVNLVKCGLGGKQGDGNQYFSWIADQDFVSIVDLMIRRENMEGVYNLAAPYPLKNADLMHSLRRVCGIPQGLNLPVWLLKLGAMVIGTETELILKSRRVVSTRLKEAGFKFEFPKLGDALKHLLCTNQT